MCVCFCFVSPKPAIGLACLKKCLPLGNVAMVQCYLCVGVL